jgi:hypothetical protein
MNRYGAQLLSGTASAIANAATRSLIQGTDFGDNILASIPDVIGATLGNMIADGVAKPSTDAQGSYLSEKEEEKLRSLVRKLDEEEATQTGAYAPRNANESSENLFDPLGTPLGPNDKFGPTRIPYDGDVLERIFFPRNARIDRVIELLKGGKYDVLFSENFATSADPSLKGAALATDKASLLRAMRRLFATNTGKRLLIAAAHRGEVTEIVLNRLNQNEYNSGTGKVYLDTTSGPRIATEYGGKIAFPIEVILGHELGHKLLGYRDVMSIGHALRMKSFNGGKLPLTAAREVVAKGDNVNFVENPLRRELGLSGRPSYNFPSRLRETFPELFKK